MTIMPGNHASSKWSKYVTIPNGPPDHGEKMAPRMDNTREGFWEVPLWVWDGDNAKAPPKGKPL